MDKEGRRCRNSWLSTYLPPFQPVRPLAGQKQVLAVQQGRKELRTLATPWPHATTTTGRDDRDRTGQRLGSPPSDTPRSGTGPTSSSDQCCCRHQVRVQGQGHLGRRGRGREPLWKLHPAGPARADAGRKEKQTCGLQKEGQAGPHGAACPPPPPVGHLKGNIHTNKWLSLFPGKGVN